MTQAHFIIDTTIIRHKDLGALDQIQGQLTQSNLVESFQKVTKQNPASNLAKRLVKTINSEEVVPLVIIGNQATMNAILNGLLAVDENIRWPLLLIDWPAKDVKAEQISGQILASLHQEQIQQVRLGRLDGLVPKQGSQFFLDNFQIGPDFFAVMPKFDQKISLRNASHQLLHFWSDRSRNQSKVTFSWTLRFGATYQNHSNSLGLQIMLGENDQDNQVRIINQLPWPRLFMTYLRGKKGADNPGRRGFTTLTLGQNEPADFHIKDIQTVKADSRLLPSGAYSFTLTSHDHYPILVAATSTQISK
ncbi:transcriptional regulator [Fructobacillus pseudoficulneus]|uniref:Transcriptional regulator n=1 Tax=Fructobacillus pseudoficulneus TaxID=220714 RepID=A0A3F3GRY6_9LACO|nr:hypothetical protein [Fructobacillus pseudoficulneus]GAP02396.1 transcriptional regulator [Fructobacillus pseudoficulneus]SEH36671.1 hypothetical protein SAMN05660469_0348 [Fructobacillus pseudoficulneus]